MNYKYISVLFLAVMVALCSACGPTEEEQARKEQARQDSLEQVHRQRMEQQRQDSLAAVRSDSMETPQNDKVQATFDENGHYAVQVESWRSKSKAQSQAATWKERGFNHAFVVQHGNERTGDVWFRVRLGKLQNREAAQQLQQKLQEKYQVKSWVSRV